MPKPIIGTENAYPNPSQNDIKAKVQNKNETIQPSKELLAGLSSSYISKCFSKNFPDNMAKEYQKKIDSNDKNNPINFACETDEKNSAKSIEIKVIRKKTIIKWRINSKPFNK